MNIYNLNFNSNAKKSTFFSKQEEIKILIIKN